MLVLYTLGFFSNREELIIVHLFLEKQRYRNKYHLESWCFLALCEYNIELFLEWNQTKNKTISMKNIKVIFKMLTLFFATSLWRFLFYSSRYHWRVELWMIHICYLFILFNWFHYKLYPMKQAFLKKRWFYCQQKMGKNWKFSINFVSLLLFDRLYKSFMKHLKRTLEILKRYFPFTGKSK